MYLLPTALAIAICWWTLIDGNLDLRPAGWLDKLVQYHRERLLKDVKSTVHIKASLKPRPEGYVDSPAWNFKSVIHLMTLIRHSEAAGEVRTALRRMLGPTRRFMSRPQSFKHFPSLMKDSANYFYYQIFSEEEYYEEEPGGPVDDDAVLQVSNPVEARLPSAQISVRLLKDILEARASAARVMPSTTRATLVWKTHSSTKGSGAPGGDDAGNGTTVAGGGNDTQAGTATGGGGGDAGGDTTTVAAAEDAPAEDPPA